MVLIFTGGEHPSKSNTFQFLQKKLHLERDSKSFIIAADRGLSFCLECGFKPDILCGDFDSLYDIKNPNQTKEHKKTEYLKNISLELQKKYPTTIVHQWPLDKDFTDTQIALYEASVKDSKTIVVIGGDAGRPDHFFANINLFNEKNTPQYWLCKHQYIQMLVQSNKYEICTDLSFSIFPILNKNKCPLKKYSIKSTNLRWPLDNIRWDKSMYSLSNRLLKNDTRATLYIKKGYFLFFSSYEEFSER
ncbi:MAG: hypothetical protein BKP49_08690 [Treponema sp. CETP13]|nr:MAG: hypothetical protein BKP49_08690 [Treponema sp. CETP13]